MSAPAHSSASQSLAIPLNFLQFFQETLELIEAALPEGEMTLQPCPGLPHPRRLKREYVTTSLYAPGDQFCLLQHPQVLGDGRLQPLEQGANSPRRARALSRDGRQHAPSRAVAQGMKGSI